MRWALVKVCLAVTTMVVVAFAIPLGLVIKEMARDRAFSNAERQAAAVAPALSITTDRDQLERVVASAGSDSGMAVHIPADGDRKSDQKAVDIGRQRAAADDIATVRKLGRASTTEVPGGSTLLQPVALSSGEIAVVEVYVPESEVSNGVATAWAVLAGVGIALVVGSVAVADRLGVRMVQPAQKLVEGAHELGEGKLGSRVPEEGPTELRLAAVAFNSMADQVVQLLANERELAADLSHRLRTPLTVLRLNAASLGDGPAAEQTRAAVAQLEREVDTIIRTAREAKPQTAAAGARRRVRRGRGGPGADGVLVRARGGRGPQVAGGRHRAAGAHTRGPGGSRRRAGRPARQRLPAHPGGHRLRGRRAQRRGRGDRARLRRRVRHPRPRGRDGARAGFGQRRVDRARARHRAAARRVDGRGRTDRVVGAGRHRGADLDPAGRTGTGAPGTPGAPAPNGQIGLDL
ncbi:UNVERIFIED_CONTAM: hypothetical protein RKD50_003734 [Streptomyces canus]